MSRIATAPGKLLLAGEYAVLEGAPAVVMAVERRARARLGEIPDHLSPFLQAVHDQIARCYGSKNRAAEAACRVWVDSDAFHGAGGTKLGLGSSAAVTVAATAIALDANTPDPPLESIHRIAHCAHARAQLARGARGSGADIAASVHGGILVACSQDDPDEPMRVTPVMTHSAVHMVCVWTGVAAHTPQLVKRVLELRRHSRTEYDRAIDALAAAADRILTALGPSGDAETLVAAIRDGGQKTAELGRAAGVELEIAAHRAIAALANEHGGAAKPVGAGAGDIAVAFFSNADDAEAFRRRADQKDLAVLDLAIATTGAECADG